VVLIASRSAARLILRAETFKAWNHTQFGSPNGDLSAGVNFRSLFLHSPARIIQLRAKIV
jgi:hypothetical protein